MKRYLALLAFLPALSWAQDVTLSSDMDAFLTTANDAAALAELGAAAALTYDTATDIDSGTPTLAWGTHYINDISANVDVGASFSGTPANGSRIIWSGNVASELTFDFPAVQERTGPGGAASQVTLDAGYHFLVFEYLNSEITLTDSGKVDVQDAFVTLTDGATVTQTCDTSKVTQNATVTLGGNRTLAISGATNGMSGVLIVKQDATGSRTLTLPASSVVLGGGSGVVTLSSAANAIDVLAWTYDGTNYIWTYQTNAN